MRAYAEVATDGSHGPLRCVVLRCVVSRRVGNWARDWCKCGVIFVVWDGMRRYKLERREKNVVIWLWLWLG